MVAAFFLVAFFFFGAAFFFFTTFFFFGAAFLITALANWQPVQSEEATNARGGCLSKLTLVASADGRQSASLDTLLERRADDVCVGFPGGFARQKKESWGCEVAIRESLTGATLPPG